VLAFLSCSAHFHFSHFLPLQKQRATSNGYWIQWFFIAQIPYKIALGFTKVSLVLLYLRIFITKTFQRVGRGYLVVIIAWTIASVLVTILQCIPIKASWDKKIVDKKCVDKNSWWYAFAAINTVTDFLIVILPIRPILNLKLSKQDRIGLLCVFGIGALYVLSQNCLN
jgi:hypothetical protein